MTEIYQPGVTAVDQRTPILPEPVNPAPRTSPPSPTSKNGRHGPRNAGGGGSCNLTVSCRGRGF